MIDLARHGKDRSCRQQFEDFLGLTSSRMNQLASGDVSEVGISDNLFHTSIIFLTREDGYYYISKTELRLCVLEYRLGSDIECSNLSIHPFTRSAGYSSSFCEHHSGV